MAGGGLSISGSANGALSPSLTTGDGVPRYHHTHQSAKPALHAPLHWPDAHVGVAILRLLHAFEHPPQLLASVCVLMLQPWAPRVLSLQASTLLRQHIDSNNSTQTRKHTNWHNRHCMRHCTLHRCMMVRERYGCCKPCHIRHSCWHWCWC